MWKDWLLWIDQLQCYLCYEKLDLEQLLEDLYNKYNAKRLTIQSGGTLNGMFVRSKLIDFVNNKLNIPEERIAAANYVIHFSTVILAFQVKKILRESLK